jgi:outer membrane protein assembly factor BamD
VHFREDQGILGYVYELDLSERDPKEMTSAFSAFKDLTTRFPDSKYYEDSVQRMRYLSNALGTYQVKVALYYYNRGAYIAAANRAQLALLANPQTPANEQALEVMRNSYEKLGLPQLAQDSQQILAKTFPDSPYLTTSADVPWWKFWSRVQRADFGVKPTGELAVKPWWQFWD